MSTQRMAGGHQQLLFLGTLATEQTAQSSQSDFYLIKSKAAAMMIMRAPFAPPTLILLFCLSLTSTPPCALAQSIQDDPPNLKGAHFRITALEESGFLDVTEDETDGVLSYSGYLISMLESLARPERANFTYDLLPPSGFGSLCVPLLDESSDSSQAYDKTYRTQYNCGASDTNDLPLMANYSTDMYLGMYYVTPSRQLQNQFTIPFLPPYSGTLAMFGTATGIPDFPSLVEQQKAGLQPAACAPAGTALIKFVEDSYPGIQLQGVFFENGQLHELFADGTCEIFITDRPLATHFVLQQSQRGTCTANGKPIGVIGDPMSFGLSHYAIGVRRDIPREVTDALSYWMNVLMSCNPLDPNGPCPDGNLATFFEGTGGTGSECGYVLNPPLENSMSAFAIAGIVFAVIVVLVIAGVAWHKYQIARQQKKSIKQNKLAIAQAAKEKELNEFIAHEVRNPLASAIAALSFVSSKASDPAVIISEENRIAINSDISVIDSSLQFVSELLRNMLDLHRSADKELKLNFTPTDVRSDVFEPVSSILFMRGAKVDILIECPANLGVRSDRLRLKQICLNLASNSTKFVEKGYIRLRAEVVKGNVLVHVEDSGPGIPPNKREKLFAKFQDSLDLLSQGTGIGLCLCKNLSELMGAQLFLDDSFDSGIPGCPGTRFTLQLNQEPLDLDDALETDMMASARDPSDELALPESMFVLFVDDDSVLRRMFTRALQQVAPTWTIQQASNGETALRMVESDSFDIIFIDQYMASIEKQLLGTETAQAMRAKGVNSIVCGLSANDLEQQFLNSGADAFMLKPFPCKKDALTWELLQILGKGRRRSHPETVQEHMQPVYGQPDTSYNSVPSSAQVDEQSGTASLTTSAS